MNENIEMIQPKRQKTMFGKIHDACGILAKVQDLQDRYNSMAIFIISHYFGTSGMADDHSDIGKQVPKYLGTSLKIPGCFFFNTENPHCSSLFIGEHTTASIRSWIIWN